MLTDIYMTFREDSLTGFQVIERTQFVTEYKENNSKSINTRVMVLLLCTLFNVD